jgi:hypothetical protein
MERITSPTHFSCCQQLQCHLCLHPSAVDTYAISPMHLDRIVRWTTPWKQLSSFGTRLRIGTVTCCPRRCYSRARKHCPKSPLLNRVNPSSEGGTRSVSYQPRTIMKTELAGVCSSRDGSAAHHPFASNPRTQRWPNRRPKTVPPALP